MTGVQKARMNWQTGGSTIYSNLTGTTILNYKYISKYIYWHIFVLLFLDTNLPF